MYSHADTIAAIITPAGIGGISIIRISGKNALQTANAFFRGADLMSVLPQTIHHGNIVDFSEDVIDETLVSVFHGPKSYTGEDIVEISCHGNPIITNSILELMLQSGARLAEPGEFTLRAFINKKIDLTQAEAVADIISAGSQSAIRVSNQHLRGLLKNKIENIIEKLLNAASLIELELDFVEEGIQLIDSEKLKKILSETHNIVLELLNTFKNGRLYTQGAKISLIGKPNAGKSSLLNALISDDRVIVSPIAGTTRDVIEGSIVYEGIRLFFYDTAGVREETEGIESLGIDRTFEQIKTSDLILVVIDISTDRYTEDIDYCTEIIKKLRFTSEIPVIYVLNKCDLVIEKNIKNPEESIVTSAKNGIGLERLKKVVKHELIAEIEFNGSEVILTNQRHYNCILLAEKAIGQAFDSVGKFSIEFTAIEIRNAIDYFGEIIGKVTSQEIINSIFANFCIGK